MEPSIDRVAYAVHTGSCTFLLDAEGLCHFIASRTGMVPPDIRGCVGAQFVACLHPDLNGLLAGELLVGAAGLFVKRDAATDKLVLMRTGTIVSIEDRSSGVVPETRLTDETLDLSSARGGDTIPPPMVSVSQDSVELTGADLEEVLADERSGGESTITLTLPLYRADLHRKPMR